MWPCRWPSSSDCSGWHRSGPPRRRTPTASPQVARALWLVATRRCPGRKPTGASASQWRTPSPGRLSTGPEPKPGSSLATTSSSRCVRDPRRTSMPGARSERRSRPAPVPSPPTGAPSRPSPSTAVATRSPPRRRSPSPCPTSASSSALPRCPVVAECPAQAACATRAGTSRHDPIGGVRGTLAGLSRDASSSASSRSVRLTPRDRSIGMSGDVVYRSRCHAITCSARRWGDVERFRRAAVATTRWVAALRATPWARTSSWTSRAARATAS